MRAQASLELLLVLVPLLAALGVLASTAAHVVSGGRDAIARYEQERALDRTASAQEELWLMGEGSSLELRIDLQKPHSMRLGGKVLELDAGRNLLRATREKDFVSWEKLPS